MDFITPVSIKGFNIRISHGDTLMFFGSCFADQIGQRFVENKFTTAVNPFGVLYNPLSIAASLRRLLSAKPYLEGDLFRHGNLYHSFEHHSLFSGTDSGSVLAKMNSSLQIASDMLRRARFLFLTFGTSWVYELKESAEVISNCHKLPSSAFNRRRVSAAEMSGLWRVVISEIRSVNPELKIILTVSPVRHLKDGAHENVLSKSELLIFCDNLQREFPESILYFPAYEIVLDELRDYRFYASDMIHPSDTAVSYVWERLSDLVFPDSVKGFILEWGRLKQGLLHRPLTCDMEAYSTFLQQMLKRLEDIASRYDFLDITAERSDLLGKIKTIE